MSSQASNHGWLRHAWPLPAALAAAAISLLCWGAWIYGYDPKWLSGAYSSWQPVLGTNQNWMLVVTLVLLLASLGTYWWPRRRDRLPMGVIAVVVLAPVAAVLGTVAYVPCRGQMSTTGVTFWIFQLFVGQPPSLYQTVQKSATACLGTPPLALQLGQIVGLGATGIGAITAASVLWRKPLDRLQSRFASDVTIFTGLNPLSIPLLKRLADDARSPRAIIVIEPDDKNPLLEEARLTGARVVIGQPDSTRMLRPIISALRGCALTHLYAVSDKVADNEAVLKEAARILRRFKAHPDRQPHLVALIDDPRHADHWRGAHSGSSAVWFEDAFSSAESTARGLVARVLREQPRHLLVCGDSSLTVPILVELARRAWEQSELVKAAAAGREREPDLPPVAKPTELPVASVALLDQRGRDIKREFLKSAPGPMLRSLPEVIAEQVSWRVDLLDRLDKMDPVLARQTAVVVAEDPPGSGVHEAGRVARLHQKTPVFVLTKSGGTNDGAIFDLLHPFEPGLLVNGRVPEDTWTRVARHWHECYRLNNPLPPGDPRAAARLPWAKLDSFIRQDNILQLRSILTEVKQRGRRWTPVHLIPEGSFIELTDGEVTEIAIAEHERWVKRRRAAGQAGGMVVPWEQLSPRRCREETDDLRVQLSRLEAVGFVPALPPCGPPDATVRRFERVGLVRANLLTEPLTWTNGTCDEMRGNPGDWLVVDEEGDLRTVTDAEFRSSHEPADDGRWRRVGAFHAWQASEVVVIRTKEGSATAYRGDWVVQAPTGERWPVEENRFLRTYSECAPDGDG